MSKYTVLIIYAIFSILAVIIHVFTMVSIMNSWNVSLMPSTYNRNVLLIVQFIALLDGVNHIMKLKRDVKLL